MTELYSQLKSLRSLDGLKEIFCSPTTLNYRLANHILPLHNWTESAKQNVKEGLLLANHKEFQIVYCEIEKLFLGIERPIISQILKSYPYFLTVFTEPTHTYWHFVNVKYDPDSEKRRLFRRYVISPDERLHTAAERLRLIEVTDEKISPIELQDKHDRVFDVEEVTNQFFNAFVEMFHLLRDEIAESNPRYKEKASDEAQTILNRLLFLYFIQKKGWLNDEKDYLYGKFRSNHKDDPQGYGYYKDFLIQVFQVLSISELKFKKLGELPFLNGGLFEVEPFQSKLPLELKIRNSIFATIFNRLLEHFNFTVREDTPLDVEVAIDPEMLGKIFENLILQSEKGKDLRKETGSYYTPRVIVHFMCQQALKEYLATEWEKYLTLKPVKPGKLPFKDLKKQREIYDAMIDMQEEEHKKKLETLLQFDPADQLDQEGIEKLNETIGVGDARLLRDIILKASILDPAVGSGAFLVGMLHQMISLIKLLDLREHGWDYIHRPNYDYELKWQIIEKCLYGVDIQEQAVRICELRLWLSLVVDYNKVEGAEIPPLPNLTYQIEQGDSLIDKIFNYNIQLDMYVTGDKARRLVDELQQDKDAYFLEPDLSEKRRMELSILKKQCDLAELLIKAKRGYIAGEQITFVGETAKERKQTEEKKEELQELDSILIRADNTKKKVEAMQKGKLPRKTEDITKLKKDLGLSFIWRLDFAEVFKEKGGFDIVIANPPYVNIRNLAKYLEKETKEFFESMFFSAKKGYDYYVLFVEKGLSLNRKNGIFCFIMPNKIQTINYAETIREYLLKQTSLRYIIDVSNIKIFKESSVYPNIFITKMASPQENEKILIGVGFKETEEVTKHERYFLRKQSDFLKNPQFIFSLTDEMGSALLEKIKSKSVPLSDLCKLHAGTTGFSASNISKCIVDKPEPNENELEFIVTGNIDRYVIYLGNVHYMKKLYQRPILRYDRRYITDGKWKLFISPKIVIGGMTKRIEAAYDSIGYAIGVGVYALTSFSVNHKYLLAILNSKLLTFIFRSMFEAKHLAGGYLAINKGQLTLLPIVEYSDDLNQKDIVRHVDQILSIYKQYGSSLLGETELRVKELENQIDQKVYEIYGLTDEEIALVENSVKQ